MAGCDSVEDRVDPGEPGFDSGARRERAEGGGLHAVQLRAEDVVAVVAADGLSLLQLTTGAPRVG